MGRWTIETENFQQVLTHYCEKAFPNDGSSIMRQDIGGGYVRCERCQEKFLPGEQPGNPRLMFRLKLEEPGAAGETKP